MTKKDKKIELTIDGNSIQTQTKRPKKEPIPPIESKINHIHDDLDGLVRALEAKGFDDFMIYLRSPWRIMWANFLAGIFKGLGILIGMTLLLGVLAAILSSFVDFPLIGSYFKSLQVLLESIPQPSIY